MKVDIIIVTGRLTVNLFFADPEFYGPPHLMPVTENSDCHKQPAREDTGKSGAFLESLPFDPRGS